MSVRLPPYIYTKPQRNFFDIMILYGMPRQKNEEPDVSLDSNIYLTNIYVQ